MTTAFSLFMKIPRYDACKSTPVRVDARRPGKHHGAGQGVHRLQIIGVLDLRGGRAVHARAGARDRYSAVQSAAGWPIDPGNVRTLAEVYTDVLGISEIYAADLDAILDRQPQDDVTRDLASMPAPLWLDAGVRSVDDAKRAVALGASRVIVGLETLPSFEMLSQICGAIGNERVVFSLDMRDGQPMVADGVQLPDTLSPENIARTAAASGAGTLIAIDVARVGTGRGLDVELLKRVRAAAPSVNLIAGGGVREWHDLVDVATAGCIGALLATALHNGRIGAAEISEARKL
jgi:phosphoribosylformimino-5-aminoimidazole carboxamide ribotide isomerase